MTAHQSGLACTALGRRRGCSEIWLDTPPEPDRDRITQLLAHGCERPIARIRLVEGDRQWFKSVHGLAWTEIDRAMSICSHAIEEQAL